MSSLRTRDIITADRFPFYTLILWHLLHSQASFSQTLPEEILSSKDTLCVFAFCTLREGMNFQFHSVGPPSRFEFEHRVKYEENYIQKRIRRKLKGRVTLDIDRSCTFKLEDSISRRSIEDMHEALSKCICKKVLLFDLSWEREKDVHYFVDQARRRWYFDDLLSPHVRRRALYTFNSRAKMSATVIIYSSESNSILYTNTYLMKQNGEGYNPDYLWRQIELGFMIRKGIKPLKRILKKKASGNQ